MVKRIQDLDQVVQVFSADKIILDQNGLTKSAAVSQLSDFLNTGINLDDLGDVSVGNVVQGMVLAWNGTDWAPDTISTSSGNVPVDVTSINNRITSVEDHVNFVSTDLAFVSNRVTSVQDFAAQLEQQIANVLTSLNATDLAVLSIRNELTNVSSALASADARITSVRQGAVSVGSIVNGLAAEITSVKSTIRTKIVSLSDVSLATGPGTNGYSIIWDNSKTQFVLSSIAGGGGGGGDVASVDARVTSVDTYFKNQVSVLGDRTTSVQTGVVALTNTVSNATSVNIAAHVSLEARINAVSGLTATVSGNVTALSSALTASLVSLAATMRTNIVSLSDVSAAVSNGSNNYSLVWDNAQLKFKLANVTGGGGGDITSVDNRVTSVENHVNTVSAQLVSVSSAIVSLIRTNIVSMADASLATGAGTNGYAVTWDNAQTKFVLSSVGGGGGGSWSGGSVANNILMASTKQIQGDPSTTALVTGTDCVAFSFVGDGDTGIFRPAANALGLAANGLEMMRLQVGSFPIIRMFRAVSFVFGTALTPLNGAMDLAGAGFGNYLTISGSAATSANTQVSTLGGSGSTGATFWVQFGSNPPRFTHSASILCPNDKDICFASGDTATFTYSGPGVWKIFNVFRKNGPVAGAFFVTSTSMTLTAEYTNLLCDGTSAHTLTLPNAAYHANREYMFKKTDATANKITIAGSVVESGTTTELSVQYQVKRVKSDGATWWII